MYDFRETTPFTGSDDNQRPAEAMLIDGQYIEDLISGYSTLQVSGRELLSQSIEKQTIGNSDGEFIQYVRNPSREIVVGYRLAAADNLSFRQAFYKLNDILHGENHQVSFNDDPSKYWLATLSDIDDVPKGRNAITSSFTLFVPDGIAHSVATQTADNMPYKNVPVNFAIASHASGSNTTSGDTDVIYMDLSEDLSGKTITTSVKVIVTNYKGKIDSGNSGGPYINIQDGMSTGNWNTLINPIHVTGNGVYTSVPKTMTKSPLTGKRNQIGVEMYNLNATIEVWVKLEPGTTASPWSPNPADPEYYTNTITVHNGGTYPVEPVITATMHADNGLIAFINSQGGVLQFGNPEEADGVERQRSEVARYEGFDKEPACVAYNTGQTNSHYYYISSQKNVMEGSVKYADDDGSAVEPVFLPTNSYYWEGPSLHLKTTNASNGSNTGSFIAKWRYKFNSSVNALGAIEMTLDNDTGVAYQVIIRSNYAGKDDVDVQVFAGSTLVFQQTLNRRVFSNGRYYEAKLTKLGNTLNLQLAGIVQGGIKPSEVITRNPPLIMPPIMLTSDEASLPITGATLWFQRFENYPYPDMGVYDMDIEWLNVDYWTDLSNRFSAGDVATIDVANRQILVNGVINADLQLIDNDWKKFRLLPGDTQILTQRSSWAQPYEVEVAFKEAFL
ncbi:distal tail protein Dit [Lacticaseibacillus paracasei]|uniref:distal tail protein Dit n=1 Tax=Lacticaseibacillus paracasei TaxID=1597 RepID=UPI0022AABBD2|nr:distal tail protein Dit [Lacticaseibacillus paracasei]MCZ2765933.1 phage tail family protein [Lacticaseibacillus paracasei]MCZ2768897.1 phage tail family protein [Lacticaseibacillus paracasei]MCZ2774435.1 phage tail family protein [Lacticaseibacillus paracasei]MCZ2777363.1 phage tail family protein [Lacticaseibacillus paracasei]MCZ2783405.1 phage tail family protein [Lacticaseibacillus paracasei]